MTLRLAAICPLLSLALSTGAWCQSTALGPEGGLSVAPVQLSLSDTRRSVSTIVANPGPTAITVQVRLYSWTMHGEDEVYGAATDAGFSPPLFRLAPKSTQAIRVIAKAAASPVERSYRLVIDQLPLADAHGQLQLPVRMVLPVFVEPIASAPPAQALAWSARYDRLGGKVVLTATNRRAVHVKIVGLDVDLGRGGRQRASGLPGYALAGQSRDWSFRAPAAPTELTLSATSTGGSEHVTIAVVR